MLAVLQIIENPVQRSAIEEIYHTYYAKMVSVAYGVLHDKSDAEDAVMEAFRYMCEKPDTFTSPLKKETAALILICVKSRALDLYRHKRLQAQLLAEPFDPEDDESDIPDPDGDVAAAVAAKYEAAAIARALASLEEMYRYPILLKYFYNMKNKDIAALLNVNEKKLNSRIFRAKIILQKQLVKEENV